MEIPNIPEETNDTNDKYLFTTLKSASKFKHSLSIKDLERNTSNPDFFEEEDLLHHKHNKFLDNQCINYKSVKQLYIERAELISIRDIMLYGKTQSVSRLLYYFFRVLLLPLPLPLSLLLLLLLLLF